MRASSLRSFGHHPVPTSISISQHCNATTLRLPKSMLTMLHLPALFEYQSTPPPTAPDPRRLLLSYPDSLPYEVERLADMDDRLDLILTRLSEAIEAKDWDVGFWRWHRDLSRWQAMKYPMKRERRVGLLRVYFQLAGESQNFSLGWSRVVDMRRADLVLLCSCAVAPGMEARIVETCSSQVMQLTEKIKYVSRKDITLPWRPIFDILKSELFPKGRKTGLT